MEWNVRQMRLSIRIMISKMWVKEQNPDDYSWNMKEQEKDEIRRGSWEALSSLLLDARQD